MIQAVTVEGRLYFWNEHQPPDGYDEEHYSPGPDGHLYRNDCSGYVSMLTGMGDNPYTGAMIGDAYSKPIGKADLRFGDIIIAVAGQGWSAGHVVMFGSWANDAHTAYHGHEFGWGAAPAHRVIQYPYSDPSGAQDSRHFQPRRLNVVQSTVVATGGASAPTPSPAAPTPPVSPAPAYTVRQGETLSGIAAAHHTTWQALAKINGLAHPDAITPGQKVTLAYTVHAGDTLAKIGASFGVDWHALAAANRMTNPNLITPGQHLVIPPVAASAPKPESNYTPPPGKWPLAAGNYFGNIKGPNVSHGGANEWERKYVEWIQTRLNQLGYGHLAVDGRFGPETEAAVAAWQHARHASTTSLPGQVWDDDWHNLEVDR